MYYNNNLIQNVGRMAKGHIDQMKNFWHPERPAKTQVKRQMNLNCILSQMKK